MQSLDSVWRIMRRCLRRKCTSSRHGLGSHGVISLLQHALSSSVLDVNGCLGSRVLDSRFSSRSLEFGVYTASKD